MKKTLTALSDRRKKKGNYTTHEHSAPRRLVQMLVRGGQEQHTQHEMVGVKQQVILAGEEGFVEGERGVLAAQAASARPAVATPAVSSWLWKARAGAGTRARGGMHTASSSSSKADVAIRASSSAIFTFSSMLSGSGYLLYNLSLLPTLIVADFMVMDCWVKDSCANNKKHKKRGSKNVSRPRTGETS